MAHWRRSLCASASTLLALFSLVAGRLAAQTPAATCPGHGSAGGGLGAPGHALVYMLRSDSSGAWLGAAVLMRAPEAWLRRPPPSAQPAAWRTYGVPRELSGATAGPLWISHDATANTIWLDSARIPLRSDNVLLLEVDEAGTPRVAGRARVAPELPRTGDACGLPRTPAEQEAFEHALWAVLRRAPAVQAFLER